MNLPPLTVIEASAGTGKTFSLVTRLLKLIFNGVEPERIVALTFSRKAAGEIFNSFIERLSLASESDANAAAESTTLEMSLSRSDFATMLRKVISRQHLSLIGTLDSFMMRVVRMMPLELGLEGEVAVMSEYRSPVERTRLVGEIMSRQSDAAKEIFRQSFRLAFGNVGKNGFLESFSTFIEDWHQLYREMPECAKWGNPEIIWADAKPKFLDVSIADIRACADELEANCKGRGVATFITLVRNFSGKMPDKLPSCLEDDASAKEVWQKMADWNIARKLEATQGIYLLMNAYEAEYATKVRKRGLITFDDMPRLLNSLPENVKLPLEYRMDARFDHWALDEFQDTSRNQWNAVRNLIYENSQPDGGKSVFIVGDRKQSIYEWRGGEVKILGEQVERAKLPGNSLQALDLSYRYVSVISEAVNRIFDDHTLRKYIDMDYAPECAKWQCREHASKSDALGYVQVLEAPREGSRVSFGNFLEPVRKALDAVQPWKYGISTAILVRKNSQGEELLGYLKANGISKVVFEGDIIVSDSPVLAAMADLVKLAEHADDELAYHHILHSPLTAALYPEGVPSASAMSAQLLADFTVLGMTRKFREVREALKSVPDSWNAFTESRFEDFIKCAAEFEEMRDPSMRLSDFVDFLSHKKRRDYAEPDMVRIMTMHQSKGLGFDWVIIPFYELHGLAGDSKKAGQLEGENGDWVLAYPTSNAAMADASLNVAENRRKQMQVYSALCLDYVAMTRAKRSLTLILMPPNKTAKPTDMPNRFSDLVRAVELKTNGDPSWFKKIEKEERAPILDGRPSVVRGRRRILVRSRPSESYYSGLRGDILFEDNFGLAAKRGVEAHARYEQIEWLDPAAARTAFDRALVKPSDNAVLWRERRYELMVDGKWETGQFDRVVFTLEGDRREAVIYDFKTNALREGEMPETFVERMRQTYSPQMAAYRRALAALTCIGEIRTVLLLAATGDAVEIAFA